MVLLELLLVCVLTADPGIYIWDGVHGAAALENVSGLAARAGFRAARLVLSPASRRTYGLTGERFGSLRALYASDAIQAVLRNRELRKAMFTAYDFTSYSDQHYLDSKFLRANRGRVFEEYAALTDEIMRRESGSGRIFIIGHWEGDNQVYCGSSYRFVVNDSERAKCLTQNPEERLAGLREWLKIRQEAVTEGSERAKRAGARNVEVYHAVEFNSLFHFRGVTGAVFRSKFYKGVLDSVVPEVRPDVCSYSAWESLNPDQLAKDPRLIAKACGSSRSVIGELGYQPTSERRDPTKEFLKAISAIRKFGSGVETVFFWEAFHPGFGLLSEDGRILWPRAVKAMTGLPYGFWGNLRHKAAAKTANPESAQVPGSGTLL